MVDASVSPLKSGGSHQRRIAGYVATAFEKINGWAEAERGRWTLWAPVAFGFGAATYLLLLSEPSVMLAPAGFFGALFFARMNRRLRLPALGVCLFFAGFAAAEFRSSFVAAPILQDEVKFAQIEGRLTIIDDAIKQRRLVIEPVKIDDLAASQLPKRIRVSWRGKEFGARPGDTIRVKASLSPPPEPAAPGGFDFARQLYFQQIGAVGFAVSAPEIISSERRSLSRRISASLEDLRVTLARRIREKTGESDAGAIVAAVITGKRGAISEDAEAAFRDSGLAHLLSISGLHMGLATGLIFFFVRAALALIAPLALNYPIKKWAALAALASGGAYLFVSGAAWPAQRAFLMSSIFFIAILVDRRSLSLRNVAIAAFIVLLITPEAVLHPGFQMSFAAVTALIAFYEWASKRSDPLRSFAWPARLRRYVTGIAVTDTIAAAATAPYSLYHFSRTANFGLAANLVSIPLMGFWVMPMAITALVMMPLGLDGPFWRFAAAGVDVMLSMGRWTMHLPGAVTVFPQWPPIALGILTVGGLWLCLASASWRLAGVLSIPIAAAFIMATPHPQLYVSDKGDNAGVVVRESSGSRVFAVFDRRKSRFDSEVWMEQAGLDIADAQRAKLSDYAQCDRRGCVVEIEETILAISSDEMGLADDCVRSRLVVALYPVVNAARRNCAAILIDRRDIWRNGAHAAHIGNGKIILRNSAQERGERPWTRR